MAVKLKYLIVGVTVDPNGIVHIEGTPEDVDIKSNMSWDLRGDLFKQLGRPTVGDTLTVTLRVESELATTTDVEEVETEGGLAVFGPKSSKSDEKL